MNLWICNPYDPLPGEGLGELRYARLARALLDQGHRVTWWSADWSHTLKRRRSRSLERGSWFVVPGASWQQVEPEEEPGAKNKEPRTLNIQLLPVPAYLKNISLRRIWCHRCYARGISKRADAHAAEHGKPDLILFSVPPMEAGAVALRLGKRYGAKVVLDVMDAWPETLLLAAASGKVRSEVPAADKTGREADRTRWERGKVLSAKALLWPYYRMMRRYCRDADAVCAQSQAFGEYARSFGATGEIPIFYLGSSSFEVPGSFLGNGSTKNEEPHPPLRLLYLGSMGRVYDLSTLVEAVLQLLEKGQAVRLDLVGDGEQRAALEQLAKAVGRQATITFHGYLSGGALAEAMASADVGVVPMHPESQVAVRYKACDYLAAHLPLVNSLPGELESKLNEYGCGRSYQVGDSESLIEALRPWLENAGALAEAKAGASRLFDEHFDPAKIYPEYAEWLGSA